MRIAFVLPALALAACSPSEEASQPRNLAEATPVAATPMPTPASSASADALTAEGWGPLRIGMSRADVVAAVGDAPSAASGEPGECALFHPADAPEGLLVMIEEDRLSRISLTEAGSGRTDAGIAVGDTADAVRAAYGDTLVAGPHKYEAAPAGYLTSWSGLAETPGPNDYVTDAAARGIRYEIGGEGTVSAIHAGGPSIQLVEGCS